VTRHHAARFTEALQAFQTMTGWWGGYLPVRLGSWRDDECMWRRTPHSDLPKLVRALDEEHDDEILLGLPQAKPFNGGVGRVSVLWVRVEGTDQLQRARKLKPRPSLALAEGSSTRRVLFWALEKPIDYFDAEARNRRLAYACKAVQRFGNPDAMWVPAPGTCLRRDRTRPVPVVVARLTTDVYKPDAVTGRLKEPPPKDAWLTGGVAR
jgi:hypothetical protein